MTRTSAPALVGRAAELDAACAGIDLIGRGRPGAVLVEGEAGIGKSSLLAAVADRARAGGLRVVDAPPTAGMNDALPYGAIAGALRALARQLPEPDRVRVFGPDRDLLAPLVPEVLSGARPGATGPYGLEQARLRLFAGVADTLDRAAADGLVLVVEDLHWADSSTLDLLSFLLHGAMPRVLLLVTYRTDELRHSDPLRGRIAEWTRLPHVSRVSLGRLDDDDVYRLLTAGGPQSAGDQLLRDVVERSAGNPYVAQELLAAGAIGAQPSGLRDAVLARLAATSPDAQRVVRAAAAGGPHVAHDLLVAVIGVDDPATTSGLREAVDAHLLAASDDGYAFPHALAREVIHDDLLPGERRDLHRRYLDALHADPRLAGGSLVVERARHSTGARDHGAALEAWIQAADEAVTSFAIPEALHYLEKAIDLWPEVPDAVARTGTRLALLHADVAQYATEGAGPARAIAHAEAALALLDPVEDPEAVALAYRSLAHARFALNRHDAEKAYVEALHLLPADRPSAARARVLTSYGLYLALMGRTGEAEPVALEAHDMARDHGTLADVLHAATSLGIVHAQQGRLDDAERLLRWAAAEGEANGEYGRALHARANLTDALAREGRLDEAIDEAIAAVGPSGAAGGGHTLFLLLNAVEFAEQRGRLREADEWLGRAFGRLAEGTIRLHGHVQLAKVRHLQGDLDAARAALETIRPAAEHGSVGHQFTLVIAVLQAQLALAEADPARALEVLEATLATGPEAVGQLRQTGGLHALAARAAVQLDDPAAIARVRSRVGEIAGNGRARSAEFEVWFAVAQAELADRGEPAIAAWSRAHQAAADRGYRPLAWYAAGRLGEELLTAGRATDAGAVLLPALAEADTEGARGIADALRGVAERGRLLTADAGPVAAHGLTPREAEVLRLLAAGATNRAVGEALFISPKTASVHVSNLLRKLGLGNRAEAAGYAHRHGLV